VQKSSKDHEKKLNLSKVYQSHYSARGNYYYYKEIEKVILLDQKTFEKPNPRDSNRAHNTHNQLTLTVEQPTLTQKKLIFNHLYSYITL
jgi:hypothetical protein